LTRSDRVYLLLPVAGLEEEETVGRSSATSVHAVDGWETYMVRVWHNNP